VTKTSVGDDDWILKDTRNNNVLDVLYRAFEMMTKNAFSGIQKHQVNESDYDGEEFEFVRHNFIDSDSIRYNECRKQLKFRLKDCFQNGNKNNNRILSGSFNPRKHAPIPGSQIKLAALRAFSEHDSLDRELACHEFEELRERLSTIVPQ
jgi:hypothetical protein